LQTNKPSKTTEDFEFFYALPISPKKLRWFKG